MTAFKHLLPEFSYESIIRTITWVQTFQVLFKSRYCRTLNGHAENTICHFRDCRIFQEIIAGAPSLTGQKLPVSHLKWKDSDKIQDKETAVYNTVNGKPLSIQISMSLAHISFGQFQKYFLDICIPAKDDNHPRRRSLNCECCMSGITFNSFSIYSLYEFQTQALAPNFFLKYLKVKTTLLCIYCIFLL